MKAMCSPETSAAFHRTARCYTSEDGTLHISSCLLYLKIITIYFVQLVVNLFFQLKFPEIGLHINSEKLDNGRSLLTIVYMRMNPTFDVDL
jgi:hypothetical protein